MPVTKPSSLVLYRETKAVAAYCGNRMESRSILCGQNTDILLFSMVVNIVTIGLEAVNI